MFELLPYVLFIFVLGYVFTVPANDTDHPDELYIIELQDEKQNRDGEIPLTGTDQWDRGADIVSADPLIPGADGNLFHVTGTTNFTAINAAQSQPGTMICLVFDGILTMTYHATNLILPGGTNITTAAGDRAIFIEESADKWRCVVYTRTSGEPIKKDKISEGDSSVEVVDTGTGYIETKADASQVRKDQIVGNIQPLQPCFLAYNSADDENVTGNNTLATVDFDTEVYDQGGNFAADTFVAPVTGKYLLSSTVLLGEAAGTIGQIQIVTSNRIYYGNFISPNAIKDGNAQCHLSITVIADMDAADTAQVKVLVNGAGGDTVDIKGGAAPYTYFSGALIC